jgi:hypothetical protein
MLSSRARTERKLRSVTERQKKARIELSVIDEQLAALADEADSASIRALVADDRLASQEGAEAVRHAAAMRRARTALVDELAGLDRQVDELLDLLANQTN